jgi:prepilin signal peptidase PulO-like enzyme (type II secretory pathway)
MIPAILAVIGAVVGLALDAIVVRLAVPFDDEDDDGESGDGEEADSLPEEEARTSFAAGALASESGALVMERYQSKWLRRPAIVLATAGLFAAAGVRYDEPLHLALVTAYVCVLIICASTDALCFRVPNVVTYPAILLALAAGFLMPDANPLTVIAGGAVAGGVLLVPSLLTGGIGMGMGDVKLVAFVGLALGLEFVVPAMLAMALLGGLVAVVLMVLRLRKRGEPIPYAPFISAGGILAIMMVGTAFESLP